MGIDTLIKKVFERDINKTVVSIKRCKNVVFNINSVFIVETEDSSYVIKLYNSVDYPEKDKALFVSGKLTEIDIPHAKIFSYTRNDEDFPNGYIINEYLHGTSADRLYLTREETSDIYSKLALQLSKTHKIKFTKCGFIFNGIPESVSFTTHLDTFFIYGNNNIKHVYKENELNEIKRILVNKLKPCDDIQPCLCHLDIQLKNLIVDGENITLIDWDDARAFPAVVDIARLTLMIELAYDNDVVENADNVKIYKKAFFRNYASDDWLKLYNNHELALHVWHGLILLNFCDIHTKQHKKLHTHIDNKLNLLI